MNDARKEGDARPARWPYLAALAAGVVSGLMIFLSWTRYRQGSVEQLSVILLYGLPVLLGIAAGIFRPQRGGRTAVVMMALALVGGLPFLGEGAACIIVVAPLHLLGAALVGWITGAIIRDRRANRPPGPIIIGFLLLPAAATWVDGRLPSRPLPAVTIADSVVIDAPREVAWATIADLQLQFPDGASGPIDAAFAALLPRPRALEGGGIAPGSRRRVVFDNGTLLATVTRSEAPRRFDIELRVEQAGREFFDHWAQLMDASFTFDALPDGRTRITHATRYRPRVAMRWYFEPIERFLASKMQGHLLQEFVRQHFGAPTADVPGPAVAAR
jgi:hypothetical protein